MRNVWIVWVGLLPLLAGGCQLFNGGKSDPWSPKDRLAVRFQQDGKKIPVRGHQVTLRKAPFSIEIAMRLYGGVFVNASFAPDLYRAAEAGEPLDRLAPFRPTRGAPKTLLVGDRAYDHWYAVGPRVHKFDAVREVKSGDGLMFVHCRKDLLQWRDLATGRDAGFRAVNSRGLYLVFVNTERGPGGRQIENERKYFKVNFR